MRNTQAADYQAYKQNENFNAAASSLGAEQFRKAMHTFFTVNGRDPDFRTSQKIKGCSETPVVWMQSCPEAPKGCLSQCAEGQRTQSQMKL